MTRILELPYRTIKRANSMHKELEDKNRGWMLLTTATHLDNVDKHVQILQDWWHE